MYKETKCKDCGTQDEPLFARQPMRDKEDFYCAKHLKDHQFVN